MCTRLPLGIVLAMTLLCAPHNSRARTLPDTPEAFVGDPAVALIKRAGDLATIEIRGALLQAAASMQADGTACELGDAAEPQPFVCTLTYDLSRPDVSIPAFVQITAESSKEGESFRLRVGVARQVNYSVVERRFCPANSALGSADIDRSSPDAMRESMAKSVRCQCNAGFTMDDEGEECVSDAVISARGSQQEPAPGPSIEGSGSSGGGCSLAAHTTGSAELLWLLLALPLLLRQRPSTPSIS